MSSTIPDAADRRAPPVPLSNSEHHPIPESSRPRAVSLSWICHIKPPLAPTTLATEQADLSRASICRVATSDKAPKDLNQA
ncbi:hypothetical protein EJB05_33644, partial [Eragrostis curvula]